MMTTCFPLSDNNNGDDDVPPLFVPQCLSHAVVMLLALTSG